MSKGRSMLLVCLEKCQSRNDEQGYDLNARVPEKLSEELALSTSIIKSCAINKNHDPRVLPLGMV